MQTTDILKMRDDLLEIWNDDDDASQADVFARIQDCFGSERFNATLKSQHYECASPLMDSLANIVAYTMDNRQGIFAKVTMGRIIRTRATRYNLPLHISNGSRLNRIEMLNFFNQISDSDNYSLLRDQVINLWNEGEYSRAYQTIIGRYDYLFTDILERYQYDIRNNLVNELRDEGQHGLAHKLSNSPIPLWDVSAGIEPIDRDDLLTLLDKVHAVEKQLNE